MSFYAEDLDRMPWEELPPTGFASTLIEVPVQVLPVEHHLAPQGTLCMGTHLNDRLIARTAVSEESGDRFASLFHNPVRLALLAREGDPGLQCRLLALIPQSTLRPLMEEDEPWKSDSPETDIQEDPLVPVLLGVIVRVEKERRFGKDLDREAADILSRIVHGEVCEVVDKLLEDL